MTDKQLKKLSRADLLEILIERSRQVEELQKEVERLKLKLSDRTLLVDEAGSIAEASLKVNKIFEDAQEAANQYLQNIRSMNPEQAEVLLSKSEYDESFKRQQSEIEEKCKKLILATFEKTKAIERQCEENCRVMVADAERKAQLAWQSAREQIKALAENSLKS